MTPDMKNLIQKIAGVPTADPLGDRMVADLIKGAQSNWRTGEIQMDRPGAETKLASYGVTPLDLAHMVGTLQALDEAGFSKKEAAEYLRVAEADIDAVIVASSE